MGDVADRYRRLAAGFTERVGAVPEDRWSSPSPCADWTARDVVRHTVETSGMFLGFIGRSLPEGPSVDDDPLGAWRGATAAVQEALDDPAVAATPFEGYFGPTTYERAVDQFLVDDTLVHTWDLARAAGLDDRLDPDEVRIADERVRRFPPEAARSPGVYGPEVEVPPDADAQRKLLAFTGRRA